MNDYLFAYGTLQEEAVQAHVLGRTLPAMPDTLMNYRRLTFQYPIAIPDSTASIQGYRLTIQASDLDQLDYYEGAQYLRVRVRLESGIEAWVYEGHPIVYERLMMVMG